jgi:hypothetical protein
MSEEIIRKFYGNNYEKVKAEAPVEIRKMKANIIKKYPNATHPSSTLMLPLPRTEPWIPETSYIKWMTSQAMILHLTHSAQIRSETSTFTG